MRNSKWPHQKKKKSCKIGKIAQINLILMSKEREKRRRKKTRKRGEMSFELCKDFFFRLEIGIAMRSWQAKII